MKAASVSVSTDGRTFVPVLLSEEISYDFTLTEGTRFPVSLAFPDIEAAFVCLELQGRGKCPKGYYREGEPSRLAIDEIEIY